LQVPIDGQPKDIDVQIRSLVLHYIRNPHSIILAVSNANVDIANSDSLQLAKEIDPEGVRSIAVCTKLDMMDRGTNALDLLTGKGSSPYHTICMNIILFIIILENSCEQLWHCAMCVSVVIKVKLGLIGVTNRSQYDIDTKKSIRVRMQPQQPFHLTMTVYSLYPHVLTEAPRLFLQEALKTEAEFFRINYPTIAHKCGIAFLATSLNRLLLNHIRYHHHHHPDP
jgi:dynamin 1-like protein